MTLSGNPLDYFFAFLGGILMSLTPCVYPLIPITIGYIGVRAGESKIRAFRLSAVYVTGIALTYSILGLIASLTGTIFGKISAHSVTYIFVGIVIIVFGVSMLDLFMLPLPGIVKLPAHKRKNYFSAFLLGMTSGLATSPCLSPVLGSILFYLVTKRSLLYGATLLFAFAYGMGLVLILIGTFSAMLINRPKSGKWMLYIKKVCAFIVIAAGIYFISSGIKRF